MSVPKHWLLGGWYPLGLVVQQQRYRLSDNNKNVDVKFIKIDWVSQIANGFNRMKAKYYDQASIGIDNLTAEQHSLSNDKLSTILYYFLRDKYYWRD